MKIGSLRNNPKLIAGICVLAALVIAIAVLIITALPTVREVQREMSLTPTPLPATPDTVRARNILTEPTAEPPLHNGSKGEKVTALQQRLAELGYYQGDIDGQFGNGTREAVVAFQTKNGLDPDGLAGEETQQKLFSDEAVPYSE